MSVVIGFEALAGLGIGFPLVHHSKLIAAFSFFFTGCGPVCRTKAAAMELLWFDAIVDLLHSLQYDYANPAALVNADVLIAVKLNFENDLGFGGLTECSAAVHFSFVTAPGYATGIHPQRQIHAMLTPLDGDPSETLSGLHLQLDQQPVVKQLKSYMSPISKHCDEHGAISSLNSQNYAAYMLHGSVRGKPHKHDQDFYEAGCLTSVQLFVLSFCDIDVANVKTTGTLMCRSIDEGEVIARAQPKKRTRAAATKPSHNALDPLEDAFTPNFGAPIESKSSSCEAACDDTADASMAHDDTSADCNTPITWLGYNAGMSIEQVVAESLGLTEQGFNDSDDRMYMPSAELASHSSTERLKNFRHEMEADMETHDLEIHNSDDEPSPTQRRRAKSKRAVSPEPHDSSEASVTKLHVLLSEATKDSLTTRSTPGLWETVGVFTESAASSSSAVLESSIPCPLGEISVVSESPKVIVRAECKIHPACYCCWVDIHEHTRHGGVPEVKEALMSWLSTSRALNSEYHSLHSVLIRQGFGMKPRRRR